MNRPSRDQLLMQTAHLWAQRGTCSRLAVGAVISREGRLLAQGYNGAPAGLPHCIHIDDEPCNITVHAEASAIAHCARYGVRVMGAEMHVTNLPCLGCAKLMVNAGITRVVYDEDYRIHDSLALFRLASVECIRYDMIVV